jgi:hypothetical protein
MLGELITEERGKVTGRRILDSQAGKMETSFTAMGRVKGVEGMDMGTYVSWMLPDGSMEGKGQGVFMTNDGQMISWTGTGLGQFKGAGKIRYKGSLHFKTMSKGSLASMNNVVGVFEHDGDIEGNVSTKTWEWK